MTDDPTAAWYRRFAQEEARGESAVFEEWGLGVATDERMLRAIRTLPQQKRQPNLVFACSRLVGAPVAGYGAWRDWTLAHWDAVAVEALVRRTQTNEPRRCAPLLPALARIPGPLALLEMGASAGLCLYPDRYAYRFDGGPVLGDSTVLLECATSGDVPIPSALPEVVWRAGIDLNPLDVHDGDAMRWLETLIWPEQTERLARIRAAVEIARTDPPHLVRGDLNAQLEALAAEAPSEATLVVMHTAVLPYVVRAERERFFDLVGSLDARWLANEAPPALTRLFPEAPRESMRFALALDGELLGYSGAHGQTLDWVQGA